MTSTPRVLFVVRPDATTRYGGDTVQARNTFAAVRELGIESDFVETQTPEPKGYDVAHVFNLGQPEVCERQFQACENARVPIVLSPVWLDLREYFGRAHAYERLFVHGRNEQRVRRTIERYRRRPLDSFFNWRHRRDFRRRLDAQRSLVSRARVVVPNSIIEARDCLIHLGAHGKPMVTAPIAADLEPASYWSEKRCGLVMVGRIETRKNQTGLAFALRHEQIDVHLVGAAYDKNLAQTCVRWCPLVRLHGHIDRTSMLKMLGSTEVHALTAWCETAGIASLEAAAAGAKIVVGDRGAELEYFGNDAEYADPADPESIRAAIKRAMARPARYHGDSLDKRIRSYTWRDAARLTVSAYELALGSSSPSPVATPTPAHPGFG